MPAGSNMRYMYVGFHTSGDIRVKENENISELSYAIYEDRIFLYFESELIDTEINPEDIISENLIPFPNGDLWQRMSDIFHYSRPLGHEHWKRKLLNKKPRFRINYLKSEMISSYIYYHFQYQEEKTGDGDKYGMIFIMGDLIVMYTEEPIEAETLKYDGLLSSSNTPANWGELMEKHFKPWPDFKGNWREMEKTVKV